VARISLDQVENTHRRDEQLFKQGILTAEEFDVSKANYRKAKEELANAQSSLEIVRDGISRNSRSSSTTQIRSTITGMILNVPIKVGNSVIQSNSFNDGTTIASVANMNDMIFRGNVDETEIGKIREGMPIKLTVGALGTRTFDAVLEYVSPKGEEKNGAIQFEIKAAVSLPDTSFVRAGYSGGTNDRSLGASIATRISEISSVSLSYTRHNFNELKNKGGQEGVGAARTRRDPLHGRSNGLNGKWVIEPAAHNKITVLAQHFDSKSEINRLTQVGTTSQSRVNNGQTYRVDTQTHSHFTTQKMRRDALSLAQELGALRSPAFDALRWQLAVQKMSGTGLSTIHRTVTTTRTAPPNLPPYSVTRTTTFPGNNDLDIKSYSLKTDFYKTLGQMAARGGVQHDVHYGLNLALTDNHLSYVWQVENPQFPRQKQTQWVAHVSDRIQFGSSGLAITPSLNVTRVHSWPKATREWPSVEKQSPFRKTSAGGGLLVNPVIDAAISTPLVAVLLIAAVFVPWGIIKAKSTGGESWAPDPWACGYHPTADMPLIATSYGAQVKMFWRPFYALRDSLSANSNACRVMFESLSKWTESAQNWGDVALVEPTGKFVHWLGTLSSKLEGCDFRVYIMYVVVALVVSSAIGVIFSYMPARSASKLNPIDALSRE